MTRFFRQPNLATDRVYPIEDPWNFKVPEGKLDLPKEQYKAYYKNPESEHCLLYMAQAQNPDYTVTVGNQAAVLYGFMADYDGILTEDLMDELRRKKQSRYQPAYWCKSQSGKLHLFWFFEKGISVASNAHANALLKVVSRKIKAPLWAVGYDPNCENVTQCMDIGKEWHVFREDAVIPHEELIMWDFALFEAGAKGVSKDVVSIPFEVVTAEIRKRQWPGHAPLDFRVGTRCSRFWDAGADNPTGAQITKDGIRVYTPHDNGFKSWRSLLGEEFCEQFIAKSTAPFVEHTFYCHVKDTYYRYLSGGSETERRNRFEQRTEKMLRRELILEAQLSDKVPKGEELSDVTKMLDSIVKRNSVDAVAPLLYRKAGSIYVPELNKQVLNTSFVQVTPVVPRLASVTVDDLAKYPNCPQRYKEDPLCPMWDNPFAVQGFPHIHRLITTLFMKSQASYEAWKRSNFALQDSSGHTKPFLEDIQLLHLISWMSHFFRSSANQGNVHGLGQALILAGPPGIGKSFFSRFLMRALMGGATDADAFYLKGDRFNESIIMSPVHLVDDKLGAKSQRNRLQFTEALKVVVANAVVRYEAKFGTALESVPWPGRIIVLANDDAQSMSVMPDLDMSTRDKFMMLKFGSAKFDFGTMPENEKWLLEEIKYFGRFLLNWQIPAHMRDSRFGVKAIQHSDMAQASAENGLTQVLVEVLETCIESVTGTKDPKELSDAEGLACEGPAVKVFKWIKSVDDSLAREIVDSRTLNQCLQTLYRNGGYNIAYDSDTKRWKIPYVLRKDLNQTVDTEGGGMV